MKKPKRSSVLVPLTMLAIVILAITALVFPASAAQQLPSGSIGLTDDLRISYDLAWDWTIDTSVDWWAIDAHEFDVLHTAHITREPTPKVVPNSAWIRGTVGIDVESPLLWTLMVRYTSESATTDCIVNPLTLDFVCPIDVRSLRTDEATGYPDERGAIIATIEAADGRLESKFIIDWRTSKPANVYRADGRIRNHSSLNPATSQQTSLYSSSSRYGERWEPGPEACTSHVQIFELESSKDSSALPRELARSTLTWCRPRPGYTVQYLGGPYGTPLVVASIDRLRRAYPNVLGDLPPLTTRAEVRDFLGSLFCNDSCRRLLQANFLAAAINALDPEFDAQRIPTGSSCESVGDYLHQVDRDFPDITGEAIVIRKAVIERVNAALLTTCPTVSTDSG